MILTVSFLIRKIVRGAILPLIFANCSKQELIKLAPCYLVSRDSW
jgi:hypothetical protein